MILAIAQVILNVFPNFALIILVIQTALHSKVLETILMAANALVMLHVKYKTVLEVIVLQTVLDQHFN